MENDLKIKLKEQFSEIVGEENVFIDELMNGHTSFRTGGPADLFVIPKKGEHIDAIIKIAKENNVDFLLFGNGSNTLVTDKGIRGVVISLKGLDAVKIDDDTCELLVGAGVSTIMLSKIVSDKGISGLEFACGIPGTIGGAIYMNAGAYGGEFKDIIVSVEYYDPNEEKKYVLSNEECKFDYRKSVFQDMNNPIILGCKLKLCKGNAEEIHAKMKENMDSRNSKQPVNFPSAGSTFKREEGIIVAKLIDEAGLKGYKIGGAEVSTLHAGFIINSGNATSDDILKLISYVKDVIYEKYNVTLHEEVKIVGER